MPPATHRCPDCGRLCDSAAELADHALYAHVEAPTPSGHIRPQRHSEMASKVAIAIAVIFGLGFYVFAFMAEDLLSPETAPLQRQSVVHEMAVELERAGDVEEFRSVEPGDDWDVEYEFDDGDGYIRIRDEGVRGAEEIEYWAWDAEVEEAMQDVLRAHGFVLED